MLRFAAVEIENKLDSELELAIKRRVASHLGANLLTLSLSDLQKALETDVRIKKVYLGRKLPSTLKIRAIPRVPVAVATQKGEALVVGEEGEVFEGLKVVETLPQWNNYKKCPPEQRALIASWLSALRAKDIFSYRELADIEWIAGRGLVLNLRKRVNPGFVPVDMGTLDFATKWPRVKVALDLIAEQKIQGESLMALGDGQVVISGVKNLHNLKNELNLKEIVRRATPPSDSPVDTRALAR